MDIDPLSLPIGANPGMFGAGLYAAQQPSSNEELRNYLGGT